MSSPGALRIIPSAAPRLVSSAAGRISSAQVRPGCFARQGCGRCSHQKSHGHHRRRQHAPSLPALMPWPRGVQAFFGDRCLDCTRVVCIHPNARARQLRPAATPLLGAPPAPSPGVDCRKCNILHGERFAVRRSDSPFWPSLIGRFVACGCSTPVRQS